MKDFFKYVGATVVGLIIFGIIATVIGIMSIVGMVASAQATKSVDKNSVLVLKLDGVVSEQNDESLNLLGQLSNDGGIGLREMLSAIGKAKTNDNIEGIYLEAGPWEPTWHSCRNSGMHWPTSKSRANGSSRTVRSTHRAATTWPRWPTRYI
jgi:protease-4